MSSTKFSKKSSFSFNHSEQLIINDLTTSSFEKTINILKRIKDILREHKIYENEIRDIDWVVLNIKQRTLFDLDIQEDLPFGISNSNEINDLLFLIKNHSQSFNENQEMSSRIKKRHATINQTKVTKDKEYRKSLFIDEKTKFSRDLNKRSNTTHEKQGILKGKGAHHVTFEESEHGESVNDPKELKLLKFESISETIIENEDDNLPEKNIENEEKKIENAEKNIENREKNINNESESNVATEKSPTRSVSSPKFKSSFQLISVKSIMDEIKDNSITSCSSTDFNIFEANEKLGRDNTLGYIFQDIVKNLILEDKNMTLLIKEDTLKNFSYHIRIGYVKDNPYHNDLHGTDVLQTSYAWMKTAKIDDLIEIEPYDKLAFLTACLVHDFKHPGLNNNFMVNSLSELAIIYNDKSTLENMHIAETFKILLRPDCNIFESFSPVEFRIIRKRMIETVLHTDMSMHFNVISIIKGKINYLDTISSKSNEKDSNEKRSLISPESKNVFDDQQEILNFVMHSADISHNTKDWKISSLWSKLVYEEFFLQGDLEKQKNLSVSMFCDRNSTNIPKAQIGFIVGIILPNFDLLIKLFPELYRVRENIEKNRDKWEEQVEEKEGKK